MASYYVYSGAAGSADGSSWANAYTKIENAFFTGKVAGDVFYVAHDHAESSSGTSLSSPGSFAIPCKIICVNRAGSVPPVAADRRTTAQVNSTGGNTISINNGHYDGVIFTAGGTDAMLNVASDTNNRFTRLDNCSLRNSAGSGGWLQFGSTANTANHLELNNTTLSFGNTSQTIQMYALMFKWRNTPSALLGTIPTTLFTQLGRAISAEIIGVDLSAAGSGKTLVGSGGVTNQYRFIDCKLNASVTKSAVPTSVGTLDVDFIRCGSAGVNYNVHVQRVSSLLTEETTIVRTGGASDGTTPIAWKIATTANCSYTMPFECPPIAIWVDTIGSAVTATVEGNATALPKDDEVWLDVEYLSDASSPQGSFVNDGKANLLAASANQATSSATWGGGAADPSFSSVKLLMGFNGTDGSTGAPGMTDESGALHGTATNFGSPQISTAQSVFGGSSLLLNGSSSISFADSADWDLSNQPFTIEFRVRPTSSGFMIGQWTSGNYSWVFWLNGGVLTFTTSPDNSTLAHIVGTSVTSSTWSAVCIDFDGTKYRLYTNGAMVGSSTALRTIVNSSLALTIGSGAGGGSDYITGHIEELRFTKGVARYASDAGYTVATSAFPRAALLPFALSAAFTAQQKGWIYARVKAGKPSTTVYIDPLVTLS